MTENVAYILDSCVFIDYRDSNLNILKIFCENIGQIFIPSPILYEVKQVEEDECFQLGIKVNKPTIDQLIEAENTKNGGISSNDNLCCILAKIFSYTVISNDKRLIKRCETMGITVIRGLVPMIMLVSKGFLAVTEAEETADLIHFNNKSHITPEILNSFKREIRKYRI